jgi:hypothetical protein
MGIATHPPIPYWDMHMTSCSRCFLCSLTLFFSTTATSRPHHHPVFVRMNATQPNAVAAHKEEMYHFLIFVTNFLYDKGGQLHSPPPPPTTSPSTTPTHPQHLPGLPPASRSHKRGLIVMRAKHVSDKKSFVFCLTHFSDDKATRMGPTGPHQHLPVRQCHAEKGRRS